MGVKRLRSEDGVSALKIGRTAGKWLNVRLTAEKLN